ncbi:TPA: hypothetical protein N7D96_004889, partial [Escherichia coli]
LSHHNHIFTYLRKNPGHRAGFSFAPPPHHTNHSKNHHDLASVIAMRCKSQNKSILNTTIYI